MTAPLRSVGPWERYSLRRRELELLAAAPRPTRGESIDRGAVLEGVAIDPRAIGDELPRHLRLAFTHTSEAPAVREALRVLATHPAGATVRELDLTRTAEDQWAVLLRGTLRPHRLVLPQLTTTAPPPSRGWLDLEHATALCEAPLCAELEQLELSGAANDAALARIAQAPWIENLTSLVLGSAAILYRVDAAHGFEPHEVGPVFDEGVAAIARAPLGKLRRLDLRGNRVSATGVRALADSPLALDELLLSIDGLGEAGLAALAASRLAPIARVSFGRAKATSAATHRALVESPLWADHWIDLWGDGDDRDYDELVEAIAAAQPIRPIDELRLAFANVKAPTLARLFASPAGARIRHVALLDVPLKTAGCRALGEATIPLETLSLDRCQIGAAGIGSLLAAPWLPQLERLFLESCGLGDKGVRALAKSAVRPEELMVRDHADARSLLALLTAPILEHVTRLHVYLKCWGMDSNAITKALLASPHLTAVRELSLPDLHELPIERKRALAARFGPALVVPR